MARELDSGQAEFAGRSHIAPLAMAKLTTYTDRTAETVDKVFYFSTLAISNYDYGKTGDYKNFLPVITGGGDFFSGFIHVPQPEDLTSFSQSFDLRLSNYPINGERLIELLQAHNLEGASIEISQLLVDEIMSSPVTLPLVKHKNIKKGTIFFSDLYKGDEHTVLFRGRVTRVSPITDSMVTLQCTTELPTMAGSWLYASDDTITDPIDLGKRLPRIYGNAKRTPLINYQVGWATTLIEEITDTTTGSVKVTDGSGFPGSTFTVRIDGEEITCSAASATTVTISARGANGTTAAIHNPGALTVELITTAIYIVSDRESHALSQLYVINPLNGMLLRLDPTLTPWTTTLADTTTIAGETITTVQFSSAQLSALMTYFKAQAEESGGITTQPDFIVNEKDTIQVYFTSASLDETSPFDPGGGGGASRCNIDFLDVTLARAEHDNNETDAAYIWIGSAPNGDRAVSRYRVVWKTSFSAHFAVTQTMWVSFRFLGQAGSDSFAITTSDPGALGMIRQSAWETPTGKIVSDIERSAAPTASGNDNYLSFYTRGASDAAGDSSRRSLHIDGSYVEIELEPLTLTRSVDTVGATGASVGFGLRFFADVSGIEAGALTPVYELAAGFESGSWVADNGAVAISSTQKDSGASSLKVTWDADAEAGAVAFTTESLSGWNGDGCSVALDAGEGHREGSNAIEATSDDDVSDAVAFWATDAFSVVEDFEAGTWNALNGAAAINATNPSTGTNSLEVAFDVDANATIEVPTESASGWTTNTGNTLSVVTDMGHTDGSGAIKALTTTTPSSCQMRTPTLSPVLNVGAVAGDGTGRKIVAFDVYIHSAGDDWSIPGKSFGFDLFTSGVFNRSWRFPMQAFTDDSWHTILVGADSWWNSSGSFNPASVNQLRFWYTLNPPTGFYFIIDNIRLVPENTVVQNNAIGSVDMTSDGDDYRIDYYRGGAQPSPITDAFSSEVPFADAWISSDTWSGTTIGTNYWSWPIDPEDEPAAWQTIPWTGAFTVGGTLVPATIKSMRLVVKNLGGVYFPRDPVLLHYFDSLSANTPIAGPGADMSLDPYNDNRDMLMFDFKIKKAGTTGSIEFRIGIDASNYHTTLGTYDVSDFAEDTWVTMILGVDQMTEIGANDLTDLNWFGVVFNRATRSAGCQVYLDNIKFVPQDTIVQRNAVGGTSFTSADNLYRLASYTDADNMIERNIWAWISSDTWSTTVIGSNYRRMNFVPNEQSDLWQTLNLESSVVDDGSPTLSAIASMRFAVRNSPGLYSRDPVNTHYIDTFAINNPTNLFSVASGETLVHPSDILLHWINVIGGETVDGASLAALLTSLGGAAEWGFDVRSLGFYWEEVLQRMAFEARCAVVPVERSTGREWKLLAADANYGFGAPAVSSAITQTHSMADLGRSIDDLASYFTFRYAFDASLPGAGSEESFTLALIVDPVGSDVPISSTLIAAADARFGALQAELIAFRCIQDTATAQDVAGYLVQERIDNQRRVFELEDVAWFDALPHDVGDIVSIQPPWATSAVTCRITAMQKEFDSQVWKVSAVEVLETGTRT